MVEDEDSPTTTHRSAWEGETANGEPAATNDEDEGQVANQLEELVISANIFKNGLVTKENFINAQRNCTSLQAALERGTPRTKVIEGIHCVQGRVDGRPFIQEGIRPLISDSILRQYAMSLHFDMYNFHQTEHI